MKSDYLVFYRRQLQSELHDPNLWRYFERHYTPVQRVTLQGLDYALIYRNPIEQHVCTQDNSLPDVLTPFGYNLAADGNLTLFWQNLKGGDRPKRASRADLRRRRRDALGRLRTQPRPSPPKPAPPARSWRASARWRHPARRPAITICALAWERRPASRRVPGGRLTVLVDADGHFSTRRPGNCRWRSWRSRAWSPRSTSPSATR